MAEVGWVAIGAGSLGLVMFAMWATRRIVTLLIANAVLTEQNGALGKRIVELEAAALRRLPHAAQKPLLDALTTIEHRLDDRHLEDDILLNIAGHINNALEAGCAVHRARGGQNDRD